VEEKRPPLQIFKATVASAVVFALGMLLVVVGMTAQPPQAEAATTPSNVLANFNVTCTSSGVNVRAASGNGSQGYHTVLCVNEGTVPVTFGPTGLAHGTGPAYCNDSACVVGAVYSADVGPVRCITETTDQVIKCQAGVK